MTTKIANPFYSKSALLDFGILRATEDGQEEKMDDDLPIHPRMHFFVAATTTHLIAITTIALKWEDLTSFEILGIFLAATILSLGIYAFFRWLRRLSLSVRQTRQRS